MKQVEESKRTSCRKRRVVEAKSKVTASIGQEGKAHSNFNSVQKDQ